MRASLEQNYPSQVFGAYASTGAKEISRAEPLWLPKHCKIIHGHFKPHESHLEVFPNSKRMVWVRDPVARVYSLVRHLLQTGGDHPQYLILKKIYVMNGVSKIEDIVFDMITNNTLPQFTKAYARFFERVSIDNIEFIGSVHRYQKDLERLGKDMGVPLSESHKNIRNVSQNVPNYVTLRHYLRDEYDIVERYI